MPPRLYSRYSFTSAQHDADGNVYLSERTPYRYRELPDNRTHVVAQGETIFALAGKYFSPLPRPAGFWWVIADFQPEPIFDPTIEIPPGTMLIIPSVRTLLERVLSEARRDDEEV